MRLRFVEFPDYSVEFEIFYKRVCSLWNSPNVFFFAWKSILEIFPPLFYLQTKKNYRNILQMIKHFIIVFM